MFPILLVPHLLKDFLETFRVEVLRDVLAVLTAALAVWFYFQRDDVGKNKTQRLLLAWVFGLLASLVAAVVYTMTQPDQSVAGFMGSFVIYGVSAGLTLLIMRMEADSRPLLVASLIGILISFLITFVRMAIVIFTTMDVAAQAHAVGYWAKLAGIYSISNICAAYPIFKFARSKMHILLGYSAIGAIAMAATATVALVFVE